MTANLEPMKWRLPIPPKVADAMDDAQKWAVAGARAALLDYGHPERSLDLAETYLRAPDPAVPVRA